ncbi:MDMPI N domain containing protein [Streptomyces piniterrae]|uniref:MDMPI N domain containing protein n=1 Tax=Streptomyces piniterrae TaxID=2571125 RepID=A0A4V5MKE9_9ACTN|nr:zf-HC2 domain-containing protein [Streptomyces piniterrae]TJZ52948.1 MDMPI N domain containing protein [Streptomyces piniterrae]
MNGPDEFDDRGAPGGPGERPRIPSPRAAAEDHGPLPDPPPPTSDLEDGGPEPASGHSAAPAVRPVPASPAAPAPPPPPHKVLKSLLGAWALAACSPEETAAVEAHLTDCASCADEALRLRDAVGLLHPADSLDLDPLLRSRVLENCLVRRPARIPVPEWATPYDAEAAKLDALLRDMGEAEWRAPVRLRWFQGERPVERETTVAGVIGHLMTVDGMVATALGLPDPLGGDVPPGTPGPTTRTETYWRTAGEEPSPLATHGPWRDQSHALIRTVSFAGGSVGELSVPYGGFRLPLCDSFLDRAFECWVHAGDIADAVDYPYEPPAAAHLHQLVDLAARLLPVALADRRRAGLASPARRLVEAGAPGRTLHLEVEGSGGGHWYIALDSPAALGSPERTVAHIALDSAEFCQLAAGHVSPEEAAAGQNGERDAIRDVLFATASLSRL